MKLQQSSGLGSSFFIVLPKKIVEAKGWKKGQKLKTEFDAKGRIILLENQEN